MWYKCHTLALTSLGLAAQAGAVHRAGLLF
jgi:hypothetical protein